MEKKLILIISKYNLFTGQVDKLIKDSIFSTSIIDIEDFVGKNKILKFRYDFFNEFFKNIKIVNYIKGKDALVELEFFVEKTKYKIERGRKPKVLNIFNFITFFLKIAPNNIPSYKWSSITNMRMIVWGNTTYINANFSFYQRNKNFFLTR